MRIYTGNSNGKKLDQVKRLDMGVMIASTTSNYTDKVFREVPCALDNGAFQCWKRGYPFMEEYFLKTLDKCYTLGISLDFIVCPDKVAGGLKSLDYSMKWATGRLATCGRLALVVQDGMKPTHLSCKTYQDPFTHIFIGGMPEWKWATAPEWVQFAHQHNKKCHIGQCGTLQNLQYAKEVGADSVDGTNIARNDKRSMVEAFYGSQQTNLLETTQ